MGTRRRSSSRWSGEPTRKTTTPRWFWVDSRAGLSGLGSIGASAPAADDADRYEDQCAPRRRREWDGFSHMSRGRLDGRDDVLDVGHPVKMAPRARPHPQVAGGRVADPAEEAGGVVADHEPVFF